MDREAARGYASASIASLGFEALGSKMMNLAEFIACTLGIRGLGERAPKGTTIRVRGDNKTAMTWAAKRTFKSQHGARAAVVHVVQNVRMGFEVVETEHLPHGKDYDSNWRCNRPSRNLMTWAQVIEADMEEPNPRLNSDMEEWTIPNLEEIIALCDPRGEEGGGIGFISVVLERV